MENKVLGLIKWEFISIINIYFLKNFGLKKER